MEISKFTVTLVILLIPGFLGLWLIEVISLEKRLAPFRFVLYSILLGSFSYFISAAILSLFRVGSEINLLNVDETNSIPLAEFFLASLVSVSLAFLVSRGFRGKWLFRLAKALRIGTKYGDDSLLAFMLNQHPKKGSPFSAEEVYIVRGQYIYHGRPIAFEDKFGDWRVLLSVVKVYDSTTAELLEEAQQMLLSMDPHAVEISLKRDEAFSQAAQATAARGKGAKAIEEGKFRTTYNPDGAMRDLIGPRPQPRKGGPAE